MSCNPFHDEDPGFEKLFVFGAGGSGREVAWLAEQAWGASLTIEFVVDKAEYLVADVNGITVRLLADVVSTEAARFVVAIGDPGERCRIATLCHAASLQETRIVHPRAEISRFVEIGGGTIVAAGVIATTNVRLGRHVHVNVGCTISHDVVIGDYATLSPGVHISGHVHVGEGVFIGTGAKIINGSAQQPLVIEEGAVIAAGACVTKPVRAGAMVAGVPAVQKR